MNNTVIVIVGPTASGKTDLAVKIAKKIDAEIISADSMQIYKGLDIATAKPTKEEQDGIPHHLIDIVFPYENFSVAKYKDMAYSEIAEIINKGKIPIIVGGTGLYIDAVINNTVFLDCDNTDIREQLQKEAENVGIEKLFEKLQHIDPQASQKLHINNQKRIIRALEVYYTTGKTITEQNELSHLKPSEYKFLIIGFNANNRDFLYDRINRRVDKMINDGLIEEAKQFFSNSYSSTAKQAIGYKELKPYLDGKVTIEEACENLKQETRRYAKRQITWFKRNQNINWLYIDSNENLLEKSLEIINDFEGVISEKHKQ